MFKIKRFSSCLFLVLLAGGLLLPFLPVSADDRYPLMDKDGDSVEAYLKYTGIVPCGKCLGVEGALSDGAFSAAIKKTTLERCGSNAIVSGEYKRIYLNCQLCHFFIMLDGVVSFVLMKIIPPVAVLMIVIGGVMFYLGGARPEMINRGRRLVIGVAIGLFLIYGAYMIVGILLSIAGAAKIEPVNDIYQDGVFSIDCPVKIPKD